MLARATSNRASHTITAQIPTISCHEKVEKNNKRYLDGATDWFWPNSDNQRVLNMIIAAPAAPRNPTSTTKHG